MDWLMMALGAVKERTEKQWRNLLGEAGLRVVGIWTLEQGAESLIEAEVDGGSGSRSRSMLFSFQESQ